MTANKSTLNNNRKIIQLTPDMLRPTTTCSQENTDMNQKHLHCQPETMNRQPVSSQQDDEQAFYRLMQNELPGANQVIGDIMTMVDELDAQLKDLTSQFYDFMASLRQRNGKTIYLSGSQPEMSEMPEIEAMAGDILQITDLVSDTDEIADKSAVRRMAQEELPGTRMFLGTIQCLVDALDWQIKDLTSTFEDFVEEINQASGD